MADGAAGPAAFRREGRAVQLVVLLLASGLAVVGSTADSSALTNQQIAVGITGVGLVIASVDAINRRGPGIPWRHVLLRVAVIGLLVLPVFVGLPAGDLPPLKIPSGTVRPDQEATYESGGSFARSLDQVFGVLIALVVLAVLVEGGLLAALVRRTRLVLTMRRMPTDRATAVGDPVGDQLDARSRASDEALRRSAHALNATDDARRAVIAAYVALEQHLASAGFPRGETETAREFVTRALVQDRPADRGRVETLLDVFGRARFSGRRITDSDAEEARGHLEALVRV